MVTESQLGGRRLEAALARIESQESDGLIVARLDYLGESLAHRLYAIERIQASCGRLVCAYNDFDFGTPAGQLVLRLILAAIDL